MVQYEGKIFRRDIGLRGMRGPVDGVALSTGAKELR
jgi:hypothetical protein